MRKAVRAIGRCAIKVETSAERCVSTLLDLIQTKVNVVFLKTLFIAGFRFMILCLLAKLAFTFMVI